MRWRRAAIACVISIFAESLLAGRALTVFVAGGQSRDFVFVADAAPAVPARTQ